MQCARDGLFLKTYVHTESMYMYVSIVGHEQNLNYCCIRLFCLT